MTTEKLIYLIIRAGIALFTHKLVNMNVKLYIIIILGFLLCTSMRAEEGKRSKPYNVNPYTWNAVGLENDKIKFSGQGEASSSRKSWNKVVAYINSLARSGKVSDMTPFRVEMTWRGRKFVRVLYSRKSKKTYDPVPGKRKYWVYDPADGRIECWRNSRDPSRR